MADQAQSLVQHAIKEFVNEVDQSHLRPIEKNYQCPHYTRKCEFYTPCCNKVYRCRFCHDADQDHVLQRGDVTEIVCSDCEAIQPFQQNCENCCLQFGKYFCLECKLFDDEEEKEQYHCTGCNICRIGDKDKFFHCEGCDMCLPINLKGKHKCIENLSRTNCPICLEDIHTSREPSQIPPCHHLIHKSCFAELTINHNQLSCPVCKKSLYSEEALKPLWTFYDTEINFTPMTEKLQDLFVDTHCRDCQKNNMAPFHIVGLKCQNCGGYNTERNKGPFYKKIEKQIEDRLFYKFLEVEISDSGVFSVRRDDEEYSNSEEVHEQSIVHTPRPSSPVQPLWFNESGEEATFSSPSTSPNSLSESLNHTYLEFELHQN